jgi:hypothetical protein
MLFKPSVAGKAPIISTGNSQAVSASCELVAVHYLNLTAGVGRINLRDGGAAGEIRVTLGAAVVSGTDDFCPSQPAKFLKGIYVELATGTGVVTLLVN